MSGPASSSAARAEGRAALIGYLPAGFPDRRRRRSRPCGDGRGGRRHRRGRRPVQRPPHGRPRHPDAADQALERGARIADVFARPSQAVRDTGAPALVMTYWNPIQRYGAERFARDLAEAGGAGCITPDLIPRGGGAVDRGHRAARPRPGLPRRARARRSSASPRSRGRAAGSCTPPPHGRHRRPRRRRRAAADLVGRTKAVTDLPVCVGLGVSTRAQAAEVAALRRRRHRRLGVGEVPDRG